MLEDLTTTRRPIRINAIGGSVTLGGVRTDTRIDGRDYADRRHGRPARARRDLQRSRRTDAGDAARRRLPGRRARNRRPPDRARRTARGEDDRQRAARLGRDRRRRSARLRCARRAATSRSRRKRERGSWRQLVQLPPACQLRLHFRASTTSNALARRLRATLPSFPHFRLQTSNFRLSVVIFSPRAHYPTAPRDFPGWPDAASSRQSARRLRGRQRPAHRHDRSHLGVRLRPRLGHPRQGQGADAVVGVLVRAHGRSRAASSARHRRRALSRAAPQPCGAARGPVDARAPDRARARRMRGARATCPARAGRNISRPAASAASRCRRGCASRTGCRSRSSRRRPRPRAATTSTSARPRRRGSSAPRSSPG